MKCTGKEWDTCRVEKMGCPGCYYTDEIYEKYNERRRTMGRKLASVQKIKAIKPIEGADKIEIVQVLNWDCVAKKGEYQVGDMVIYFEIDSLLPDIPMLEWLKGSSWSQKLNKYKISTHKFRGQISQGLVMPIKDLDDLYCEVKGLTIESRPVFETIPEEGTDLTEMLNIEKYEPPVSNGYLGDLILHEWYVPKTDEERIQVCAEDILPKYMESEQSDWYASVKLDGCSCTAGLFEDMFLIGGRNQWYKGPNMYTETVKKYITEEKLRAYHEATGMYVVFQGELCGPGIQSNRLGLPEKDWFIFNVFTSDTGKMDSYTKCDLLNMLNICEYFGLKTVPLIPFEAKFDFKITTNIDETVENLLKYVDSIKYRTFFDNASPSQIAEGAVFRMNDMNYSFKVVSNKFLLKGGE